MTERAGGVHASGHAVTLFTASDGRANAAALADVLRKTDQKVGGYKQ
jgi:hypothetical protein